MISGQFESKIAQYFESQNMTVSEALINEASKRCGESFKRQLMEDRQDQTGRLRLSAGGQCVRKQWYSYKGCEQEKLSSRTVITFLNGDLLEVAASILGRLSGWKLLGKDQKEDVVTVDGIEGHIDDLLEENGKIYLVEYKSMSEFSFRRFEKEGIDDAWGYQTQASLYCEALGLEEYVLVGICKNTGHICSKVYPKNKSMVEAARNRFQVVKNADNAPAREFTPEPETKYNRSTKVYDPTGRSILGIQCSYCGHKDRCWPEAIIDTAKEKPVWIIPQVVQMAV